MRHRKDGADVGVLCRLHTCVSSDSGRSARGLARVAAMLVGLCLAILLAELVVRLAGQRGEPVRLPLSFDPQAVDEFEAGRRSVRFDPQVGWLPTPDFDAVVGAIHERSNHSGLRADREYAATPPAGVRRI